MKPIAQVSLLLLLLLPSVSVLFAQPGTLSSSFGTNGLLTDPTRKTYEKAIVSQPDKKIVIGSSGFYQGYNTFQVDRLMPDGSKDSTFGTAGTAYAKFANGNSSSYVTAGINAIAILPDGKIVAAGYGAGSDATIALARFLPTGAADSSFGSNGTSFTGFYADDIVNSIALQPDGKIVVCGQTETDPMVTGYYFFTARYLSNGNIDKSFGNKGIVLSKSLGEANAVEIQTDGSIVAAGYSNGVSSINFHTERYKSNGSYDNTFGTNGIVDHTVAGGFLNFINDVAIQNDNKIVVAGRSNGSGKQIFTVVRYNSDGSFDNTFDGNGTVTTFIPDKTGVAQRVLITGEKGDRIIVTGSDFSSTTGGDFVIFSYLPDGSLDSSFGNAGSEITDFSGTDFDNSACLRNDGKIILLGNNLGQYNYTVRAMALYNGYPVKASLFVRVKHWLQNHNITWNGLPASEQVASYNIEQSDNSRTGFTDIAKINGRGHLPDYSINNSHLLQGMNYYRVKAVSLDGTIRYSEVVSADNSIASASLFPNPALDYVFVKGLRANETANISISNGSSNILAKAVSTGSTQYRLNIGQLKPGTYYINIAYNNTSEVLKLVKGSK